MAACPGGRKLLPNCGPLQSEYLEPVNESMGNRALAGGRGAPPSDCKSRKGILGQRFLVRKLEAIVLLSLGHSKRDAIRKGEGLAAFGHCHPRSICRTEISANRCAGCAEIHTCKPSISCSSGCCSRNAGPRRDEKLKNSAACLCLNFSYAPCIRPHAHFDTEGRWINHLTALSASRSHSRIQLARKVSGHSCSYLRLDEPREGVLSRFRSAVVIGAFGP